MILTLQILNPVSKLSRIFWDGKIEVKNRDVILPEDLIEKIPEMMGPLMTLTIGNEHTHEYLICEKYDLSKVGDWSVSSEPISNTILRFKKEILSVIDLYYEMTT